MIRGRCQAVTNGKRACRAPAWGATAYCVWHNAFLSWRMMGMVREHQRRSVGWAPYDVSLVDWSVAPKTATAEGVTVPVSVPLTIFYLAVLHHTPFRAHPLLQLDASLWFSAYSIVFLMISGNSNRIFPRLLVLVAIAKIAIDTYLMVVQPGRVWDLMPPLVAAVGLLCVALPPPTGPLINRGADPEDVEQLPPMNAGHMVAMAAGFLLLVVGGVWFLTRLAN